MYHCYTHFYFTGQKSDIFRIFREIPPFEHFTHEFSESTEPVDTLTAGADILIANLQDSDEKNIIHSLIQNKKEDAALIVLADKGQTASLSPFLSEIQDIWIMPMSEEEARFRFLRWQQSYKMSKDLWETSQYLESTINNIPNLIWYKDKNGIHEKVNDNFCKTVNKTKEQVQGRGHAYIWDVEFDDPACIESERKVMTSRKTCVAEETIETGEGTRLLTTYKSPLYDIDGSVMGTVGVAIDITQEHAYEQELRKKNHALETVFTTMDCGILCHTIDGSQIISINKAALNILGYDTQEELIADGFATVAASVMEEDKPKLRERIKKLEKNGDNVNIEYRVQHKNGDILHVMGNVKLVEENGQLFYQRYLLDCTTQKIQEEKKQREAKKHQTKLIHALSIDYNLVYFFDLYTGEGIPLRMGKDESFISDYSKDGTISLRESMEQYVKNYVYEEDREMLLNASSKEVLIEELSKEKVYYVNYRTFDEDGIKYYQLKAVRTGSDDKKMDVVIGFRSIDAETRDEMEQKSLLEDALMQAKKASEAKSVFLSNMSHDIRTPMNAIVGFTTLAISHLDRTEQVKEYLHKIQSSGNHLLNLINDVLDMSRIESGKMHLEEKPCHLPEILHGLYNILQADIRSKHQEFHMEAISVKNENIYCDKLRLNQVLLNLLSNAIKYTNEGGSISVILTEQDSTTADNASYANKVSYANFEFRIIDTGIGMSEEFIQHIFEPFEREQNSTTSGIQGTGLGMAITKNIVDMMNGSIDVKSHQGEGTEFTLTFSFRLNEKANPYPSLPELEGHRALIVAEHASTCENISAVLQKVGIKPEWTLSGKETLELAHAASMTDDNYCVYIIDWYLTDTNAIELTQKLKKETDSHPPIIFLSAFDWTEIEDEATAVGVTNYCSKPIFSSELLHCLNTAVNKDRKEINQSKKTAPRYTGHILLAEDIELNQEIAVTILDEAGFITEVAENGQVAVDMLKNSEPGYYQLILMDIQMPFMNGYEATIAIRNLENKALASIPILAMSANAFEEDKQESLKCGMNGHISKPINIDVLFETLDKIIS